jgi:peptidyl-prolyl cis-trans isomerase B (cyclophilin B)
MRASRLLVPVLFAVAVIVLVASIAVAGDESKPAPKAGDVKAALTKDAKAAEAKMEAKEGKEEAKQVMATLTYISEAKDAGKKLTKEVSYLPEGRKIATMETSKGTVKIELWEDKAPNTVINFVHLANSGRYDGVEFHRVIDGFMAQTGDVEHKKGTGGPGYSIPGEFDASLKHERGVVSMARASDPDSGGSQFFIMFKATSHLDGKYAAFGKVLEGMDVIDSLTKGDGANGAVSNPDKIVKLRVESVADAKAVSGEKAAVEKKVLKKKAQAEKEAAAEKEAGKEKKADAGN